MRVSKAVLEYLKSHEVKYIFGIPAGNICGIFDSFNDVDISPIITKNEAGATYCATKYASVSRKLGVALIAGAVGVGNCLNGIAEAARSKTPVLVLSGYVKTWQRGKGAIQELDCEAILKPITKYSKTIDRKEDVLSELSLGIKLALTEPCGPVHIAIPIDIQMEELDLTDLNNLEIHKRSFVEDTSNLDQAFNLLKSTNKSLVIVGGGAKGCDEELVNKLAEVTNGLIVSTPSGKGVVSRDVGRYIGNFGFAGTDRANSYVDSGDYDTVIALGTTLGEASTRNYGDFMKGKKLIHVDLDRREKDRNYKADVFITASVETFLKAIIERLPSTNQGDVVKYEPFNDKYECNHTGLSLRRFMEELPKFMDGQTLYVSDIGETINFTLKHLQLRRDDEFEFNLNYGCMGSGIGGAPGAHLARLEKTTVVIVGDGSFFMNGSEVLTAKHYNLPIIYFVINNSMLGYVENGHKFLFGRNVEGFVQERVSIADIGKAYHIETVLIEKIEDITKLIGKVNNRTSPLIVEVITDGTEKAPLDRFKSLNGE